jgi:hypothetical protein
MQNLKPVRVCSAHTIDKEWNKYLVGMQQLKPVRACSSHTIDKERQKALACIKFNCTAYTFQTKKHVIWLPPARAAAPHVLRPYVLDRTHIIFPGMIAVKPYKWKEAVAKCFQRRFKPYFVLQEPSNTIFQIKKSRCYNYFATQRGLKLWWPVWKTQLTQLNFGCVLIEINKVYSQNWIGSIGFFKRVTEVWDSLPAFYL